MAVLRYLKDRGVYVREVPESDVVTNDGITGFIIDGKKYVRNNKGNTFGSQELGIYANGADMTSKLQTALNHSAVQTIVFDAEDGDEIVISGTVTVPVGKVLKFEQGTKLSGTGTINGGIINAVDYNIIFNPTLNIYPESSVKGYFVDKWFGVKANGVDDDTLALQKAINASAYTGTNSSQAILVLCNGNHIIKNVTLLSNLKIKGAEGRNSILTHSTASVFENRIMFGKLDTNILSNLTVENVFFQGNNDILAFSTYGIYIDQSAATLANPIKNIKIINCEFNKIDYPITIIRPNKNVHIEHSVIESCENGIMTADCNHTYINNNKFYDIEYIPCEIRTNYGNPSKYVHFKNNYAENFRVHGVHFSDAGAIKYGHYNMIIEDNVFIGQGVLFADGGEGTADVISLYNCRKGMIKNNYVYGSGDMAITLEESCQDMVVTGNNCEYNAASGLIIHGGKRITVTGNIFRNNGYGNATNGMTQSGVVCQGTFGSGIRCEHIIIEGNVFDDTQAVKTQLYDIEISAADVFLGNNTAKTYRIFSNAKIQGSNIPVWFEIPYTALTSATTQQNLLVPYVVAGSVGLPIGTILKKVIVQKEVAFTGVTNPRADLTVDPPPNYEEVLRQFSLTTTGIVGNKVSELGIEMEPTTWSQGGSNALFETGGKLNMRFLADTPWGNGTVTNLTEGKLIVKCICDFNMN